MQSGKPKLNFFPSVFLVIKLPTSDTAFVIHTSFFLKLCFMQELMAVVDGRE